MTQSCRKKIGPYDCCSIVLGDCNEALPSLAGAVDLVVTDPPYGMRFQSNHRQEKHRKIAGDDALPVESIKRLIALARRASYFFCRWDNLAELPKPKSVLAWVKNNWSMGDLKHEHGRQWEACCFYPGPEHEFVKRIPDVLQEKEGISVDRLHPTQKPVNLFARIIAANKGDMVFDPYMGSGTAAVAAHRLGRHFLGFEIDPAYHKIACERLEAERTQQNLFGDAPEAAEWET